MVRHVQDTNSVGAKKLKEGPKRICKVKGNFCHLVVPVERIPHSPAKDNMRDGLYFLIGEQCPQRLNPLAVRKGLLKKEESNVSLVAMWLTKVRREVPLSDEHRLLSPLREVTVRSLHHEAQHSKEIASVRVADKEHRDGLLAVVCCTKAFLNRNKVNVSTDVLGVSGGHDTGGGGAVLNRGHRRQASEDSFGSSSFTGALVAVNKSFVVHGPIYARSEWRIPSAEVSIDFTPIHNNKSLPAIIIVKRGLIQG